MLDRLREKYLVVHLQIKPVFKKRLEILETEMNHLERYE